MTLLFGGGVAQAKTEASRIAINTTQPTINEQMNPVKHILTALLAGAVTSTSALNVTIGPAQSIQSAIDQVRNAGGGVVHLNAGTYTISATIKMYSNITLEGSGSGSTIIQPPNSSFASELISDGTHANGPVLSKVTIQNLTLDGRGMKALNSMGIQICCASGGTDTDITLSGLEIRNCAQGAGLGRMNRLNLKWNNMHHNGIPVPGSNGLIYQNCYITASQNVNIPGGTFNNSQGCGLKLGFGGSGMYVNCQSSNNGRTGIAVQGAGFSNVTLQYCTANNNVGTDWNADGGLMVEGSNMTIDGCTTKNNARWGIRTWGTGTVKNCVSTGNASGSGWNDNYGIGAGYTQSNNN